MRSTDPYAKEPRPGEDWIGKLGAHIMVLVSDNTLLAGLPMSPQQGGPWVRWAETPYAHLVIPVDGSQAR